MAASNEFRVNTYTNGDQRWQKVAPLNNGGFVVIWLSNGQNASGYGVYGQQYNASGQTVGSEFQISSNTYATQQGWWSFPSVASLADGGFYVTWSADVNTTNGWDVYGKRYDATGQAVGSEVRLNTYSSSYQYASAVRGLADGGYIVTWESLSQDNIFLTLRGQRYNAAGQAVGSEFKINTNGWHSIKSDIALLKDGGFVVTWHSEGLDGSAWGIFGQRYNAAAQPVGSEFQINTYTDGWQIASSVAGLTDGGFVVTWESNGPDGSATAIEAQRYNAAGQKVGSEFQVNTYTQDYQVRPRVAAFSNGGFVVTWQSTGQDGSGSGVYAQQYNAAGQKVGSEFQVNTYTPDWQYEPSVAVLKDDKMAFVWTSGDGQDGSGNGVYGRIFDSNTGPASISITDFGGTEGVNNPITSVVKLDQASSQIVTVDYTTVDGTAVAGSDYVAKSGTLTFNPGETSKNITVNVIDDNISETAIENFKIVLSNPSSSGVIADNEALGKIADTWYSSTTYTLPATVENLYLTGTTKINGSGNNNSNYITGSLGNNLLVGLLGNDTIHGGVGDDTLDGGIGNDTYTYTLNGNSGSDQIIESTTSGVDTIDFTGSIRAVNLNLGLTTLQTVAASSLKLQLSAPDVIENAVGSIGNDTLSGNILDNNLNGATGNDQLSGSGGNDTLTGGGGNDSFVFSSGQAFSVASTGIDTITDFVSTDKIVLSKGTFLALASVVGSSLNPGNFATVSNNYQANFSSAGIVYSSSTGDLFYNSDGAAVGFGSGGQFAQVLNNPALSAANFSLIA